VIALLRQLAFLLLRTNEMPPRPTSAMSSAAAEVEGALEEDSKGSISPATSS
jgi:hypothetical protein